MPGFRKKKRHHGPSKNELKVNREDAAERRKLSAQTLSAALPEVAALTLEAVFLYPADNVVDRRKSEVAPSDPLPLTLDCPGHCGSGRFKLEPRLVEAAAQRQDRLEWREACVEASATGTCGCALSATVSFRYR